MATSIRIHHIQRSKEHTQSPAQVIQEQLGRLREDAEKNGWGKIVGEYAFGSEVHYTFESGVKIVCPLPSGSNY